MPAWEVNQPWDREQIRAYRTYVPRRVARFQRLDQRFTCEDLALELMIEFAAEHELPLLIANGQYSRGIGPGSFEDLAELKRVALRTSAAIDILNPINTVEVEGTVEGDPRSLRRALPGDLIFLDYSERWNHIQVVTFVDGDGVEIAQGNLESPCGALRLLFSDIGDPQDSCYAGYPIHDYAYDYQGIYSRDGHAVFANKSARVRRWNFDGWNTAWEESDPRVRLNMAPPSRPGSGRR
ncbi:MAG: hypothetical protein KDC38_08500 [Planctomycetes bacterium]|nr:hypothetical protein [Planctomycetota bacterium]